MAPPFKRVELDLLFSQGISQELDLLDAALHYQVMTQSGSWFALAGEKIAQGREQALSYLKEHPDIAQKMKNKIKELVAEPKKETK